MPFEDELKMETYKSLMTYGSSGLKFVFTSNGAAAISVLTFLGHFVASGKTNPPDMRVPLAIFLAGIIFGGLATFTTYLTQLVLYNQLIDDDMPRLLRSHIGWLIVSSALIVLGICSFGVGAGLGVFSLY